MNGTALPPRLAFLVLSLLPTLLSAGTPRATHYGPGDAYLYADHPALGPAGALTLEAWVRLERQDGEAWLVAKGGSEGWRLGVRDRAPFIGSGAVHYIAPALLPLGQWCHVAGTWGSDGSLSIIIDGALAGTSGPLPGNALPTAAGPLAIGDAGGDAGAREYALDEVRIWATARSATDVQTRLFEEVRDAPGLLAVFPAGGGREALHALVGSPAGTPGVTPCGILPSSLEVPLGATAPVLDGIIEPLEYRRGEEVVLRYHDPTALADATARLVHTATDLFLAVEGLRAPAEDGATPAFWVVIEPASLPGFALELDLDEIAQRFYLLDQNGNFRLCGITELDDCPDAKDLAVRLRGECDPGGNCTITIELRFSKTLVGGDSEIALALLHDGYRSGVTPLWSWTAAPPEMDPTRPGTWAQALLAPGEPGPSGPGDELVFLDVKASELPRICDRIHCAESPFGEPDPAAEPEPGFAFFVDFYEHRILHPVGTPFFRPGDWELRVEDPLGETAGLPLILGEFREAPIEGIIGEDGLIGDGIGEGVKLFFVMAPDLWRDIQDRKLDLVLTNHTGGTEREMEYPIRVLGLGQPDTAICPHPWWVDLFIQEENLGFSPSTDWPGWVREINVLGGVGERPSATFYVAISSNLPVEGVRDYRVQGWAIGARLTGGLDRADATLEGTVAEGADLSYLYDFTPPDWINPFTGLPQGHGFAAFVVPDWDAMEVPGEPHALPSVGTSTILAVTVTTRDPLCSTCVISGEVVWQDGMQGYSGVTGSHNPPSRNMLTVAGDGYYFCATQGVRIHFRAGWYPALVSLPDEERVIPGLYFADAPSICDFIPCPVPFGSPPPEPRSEPGFSFFLPFTDREIRHPAGIPFFRHGDWELEVRAPDGQITPVTLRAFREDQIEIGSGILGDEPGEGVILFFALPPELVEAATGVKLNLTITNRTRGTPREGSYLLEAIGYGSIPPFLLCPGAPGDPRVDVIVQEEAASSPAPLAGATDEVRFGSSAGESRRGTFRVGISSDFPGEEGAVEGWSLAASVSGARVIGGRAVGIAAAARDGGYELFEVLDPTLNDPRTGLPQGEGFVQVVALSHTSPVTLPRVGTETVCEVDVEAASSGEGTGRVEWRDALLARGGDPAPVTNTVTVLGRTYRLCSCRGADLVFEGTGGSFRRGDSNGDAEVDLSDALRTLGYLFLGAVAPDCPDAADANDDARLDISDAVGTLGFLFLGSAPLPPPGPIECGPDPTGDGLGECEGPCSGS